MKFIMVFCVFVIAPTYSRARLFFLAAKNKFSTEPGDDSHWNKNPQ